MNGQELLMGLSYIDRKFIEESEQDTIPKQNKRTIRRPLLVAAIVVLIIAVVRYFRKKPAPAPVDPEPRQDA